jgi:hypothetical protein
MTHYFCVISLAAASILSSPDSSLEKFEEKMKKKWDSILQKHPIDLASTTDFPEVLAAPTTTPDDHILDTLKSLDDTTAAPTLFAALDDLKAIETTASPSVPDIDAELANLKARLHADDAMTTIAPLATEAPTEAPAGDVAELLANLHKHIHDVHSSVHDALDGSLSHPAIQPSVDALHAEDESNTDNLAKAKAKLQELLMHPPAGVDAAEDAEAPEPSKDDDSAAADAPAAEMPEKLSAEKAEAMQGMKRLMGAVKMIVMLQPMLEPLKEKLTLALEHMSEADAKKANGILKHIKVLGVYSKVTAGLMAGVVAAKKGTAEDREKAIATLIVGVKQIQEKVAKHLMEMKKETLALPHGGDSEAAMPADPSDGVTEGEVPEPTAEGEHAKHAEVAMDKMTALLVKLGKKIATEIKDPANRHNPKVLLDIKLFLAVKDSVEKTQALMMAGSIAIKKAKTEEEKAAVQAAVKKGMGKVEQTLKTKMMALEKQALLLAVASAKQQEAAEKAHSDEDEAAGDAEAAQDDEEEVKPKAKAHKKKAKKAKADGDDDAAAPAETPPAEAAGGDDAAAGDDDDSKTEEGDESDDAKGKVQEKKAKGDDDADADAPAAGGDNATDTQDGQSADDSDDAEAEDKAEDKAPPKTSAQESAKSNHPEISTSDIEHIFEEAADDATGDSPSSLAEVHLRAH